jgi:hypothetical protein
MPNVHCNTQIRGAQRTDVLEQYFLNYGPWTPEGSWDKFFKLKTTKIVYCWMLVAHTYNPRANSMSDPISKIPIT